jgi:ribonuclease Z
MTDEDTQEGLGQKQLRKFPWYASCLRHVEQRQEKSVKKTALATAALAAAAMVSAAPPASAAPCLVVTLTGTKGGPNVFEGLAGPGTLVTYGDDSNDCRSVLLQFDVGRGTTMRLSQINISIGDLNAIFLTHTHSDHVDGLADLMQLRWHYYPTGPKIDLVCSADVVGPGGFTTSCRNLALHIADAYLASGEIAQRHFERKETPAGGPAEMINLKTFERANTPQVVWTSGDVKVSAIASTHTPDHASYRVDTPAGSVVIGGDASNDTRVPPRAHSTSDEVELLAKGADILVHTTTHPNMGPEKGGGMPAPIFYRQSTAPDLGAMAQRDGIKYLMLTHLTPSLGALVGDDNWKIPGAPLTQADFEKSVRDGGFTGTIIVGTDLVSLRLPAK